MKLKNKPNLKEISAKAMKDFLQVRISMNNAVAEAIAENKKLSDNGTAKIALKSKK